MSLISIQEAAKIIGVTPRQVYRLFQPDGKLTLYMQDGVQMVIMSEAVGYREAEAIDRRARYDSFLKVLPILDAKYGSRIAIAGQLHITDRSLRNYVSGVRVPDEMLLKRMWDVSG